MGPQWSGWQGLMPPKVRKRRWPDGHILDTNFGNIEPAPLEYPDDDSVNSFERRFPGATSDDPIYRSFVRALDLGGSPDANLARWGDVRGGDPAKPVTQASLGKGSGKSMAQRVAEKLAEMEVPEHAGFDSPLPWGGATQWNTQNMAHTPVGSLMNMGVDPNDPRKRKGPY